MCTANAMDIASAATGCAIQSANTAVTAPNTSMSTKINNINDISSSSNTIEQLKAVLDSCDPRRQQQQQQQQNIRRKRKVSFRDDRQQQQQEGELACCIHVSAAAYMSKDERKAICWYSDEELAVSRQDAKRAIQALQRGEHIMVSPTTTTTTTKGEENSNNNNYYYWRGIEKYVDAMGKVAQQKRLVGSVLHQQSIDGKSDHVALVSRTLSQPFKDLALYYGQQSAQQLQDELREEERQQQRKATRDDNPTAMKTTSGQKRLRADGHDETQSFGGSSTNNTVVVNTSRSIKQCLRRIISE
jgi:hypothetical protein